MGKAGASRRMEETHGCEKRKNMIQSVSEQTENGKEDGNDG
jgi:hypothetical protein